MAREVPGAASAVASRAFLPAILALGTAVVYRATLWMGVIGGDYFPVLEASVVHDWGDLDCRFCFAYALAPVSGDRREIVRTLSPAVYVVSQRRPVPRSTDRTSPSFSSRRSRSRASSVERS